MLGPCSGGLVQGPQSGALFRGLGPGTCSLVRFLCCIVCALKRVYCKYTMESITKNKEKKVETNLEENGRIMIWENSTYRTVSYPGKGECADPVYEDAILERVGGESPGRNKKRQLASDTGGSKTWISVKWEDDRKTKKTTPSRLRTPSMHRVSWCA